MTNSHFKALLIDADSLIYSAGSYTNHHCVPLKTGEYFVTHDELRAAQMSRKYESIVDTVGFLPPFGQQLDKMNYLVSQITQAVPADTVQLYVSSKQELNPRLLINPSYKAQRTTAKPPGYARLKKYLLAHFQAIECLGIEADDKVVWDKYTAFHDANEVCIATADKDILRLVPGQHHDYYHQTMVNTSDAQAARNFGLFLLSGDGSDNILGLHGLGEVKFNEVGDPLPSRTLTAFSGYTPPDETATWQLHLCAAVKAAYAVYRDKLKSLPKSEIRAKFLKNCHLLWLPVYGYRSIEDAISIDFLRD